MVWKKNSVAVRPEKKEFETKPLAAGSRLSRGKCGSARCTKPSGARLPETVCWPTHATICEMLMSEPLEPHTAMSSGALSQCSSLLQMLPASPRICERTPLIFASRVCSALQPGDGGSLPSLNCLISSRHARLPSTTSSPLRAVSAADGVTSEMPIEKPWFARKRAVSLASRPIADPAATAPSWRNMTAKRESLEPEPTADLSSTPARYSLLCTTVHPSLGHMISGWYVPLPVYERLRPSVETTTSERVEGRSSTLMTCLPVHSSSGLRMAGGGNSTSSAASAQ
mmetsp:Transcript_19731/g.46221  ORF Transcript_19731/g.46221 Transcript_19731/m.46221 type:complete len:284 (+) Transcript_19731:1899-2750(+)